MIDDRGVFRSGVISDGLWAVIEPVLPSGVGRRGRPWNDHRRTLEAIAWRFRTGSPWRDIPEQFGAWQSVWERHRRWSSDGTYTAMFAAVREQAAADQAEEAGLTARLLSIDSTSVRAHQHAAGARFHHDSTRTGGSVELQESARRTG
jgi:putative transposase